MNENVVNFRFIKWQDNVYLRKEDVMNFLVDIGSTEETDVRNRLTESASKINQVGQETKNA